MTRLYRSEDDRVLGGVCGGLAEIYGLDPSLVRLATFLLLWGGVPVVLYIIAWIVIPPKSEVVDKETGSGGEESREKKDQGSQEELSEEQEQETDE